MQLISKRVIILIIAIFTGAATFAQTIDSVNYVEPFSKSSSFRTWSIGINGGLLVPYNEDYSGANYNQPGFGIVIKKQFTSALALQTDLFGGQAIGYNSRDGAYSQYKTQMVSAALSVNLILGNISWRNKKNMIQPYITAGYGYMGYQPVLTTSGPVATQTTSLFKNPGNGVIYSTFVPVSGGFKINVSPNVSIDFGYTVSFVNSDNFDGSNFGTRNDEFSYIHAGLEFALGSHKKPQLATHNPVASMRTEYLMIENSLTMKINAQKALTEQLRSELATKTALINSTNASLIKFTTDSDGDGVPDLYDKCPNTPPKTVIDGSGCPLVLPTAPAAKAPEVVKVYVTEQDKKVVKDAVDNLQFDFGKSTIREVSFETLDQLAKLLVDRKLSLKLSGYTDNMGPDAVNLRLSKARAEAVKSYLVSKGVNAAKIEATGYGKENPVAPNNTVEGRVLNRRVEFNLF